MTPRAQQRRLDRAYAAVVLTAPPGTDYIAERQIMMLGADRVRAARRQLAGRFKALRPGERGWLVNAFLRGRWPRSLLRHASG